MKKQFHPINCIVPPYMLRSIAERGSEAQRQIALHTIQVTGQFQGQRVALKGLPEATAALRTENKQRNVYTSDTGTSLPGRLVRKEGDPPTGDLAVDEAYEGAGDTFDLYWDVYDRNSIDDQGIRIDSTVHYQKGYDNAFWNGFQMVYGDGDEDLPPAERLFNRFTIAVDVIGHELTHGVTQFEANLTYWDQSGALNESLSDVFGALVKQRKLGQEARDADWIIGRGLFTPNVKGVGIRSMKEPGTAYDDPVLGKDPQPGHMKDYVSTVEDSGGVHINSGIPNRAFYLAAYEIGGFAWEKAGQVWYIALRDKLQARANFQDAAQVTALVAGELFGTGSLEQEAVRKGWLGVGINPDSGSGSNGSEGGLGCISSLLRLLGWKTS